MKKRGLAFLMVLALGITMAGCTKETAKKDDKKDMDELDDMDVVFSYEDPGEYITIPDDYIGIEVTGAQEISDTEVQQQIGMAKYSHMKTEQIKEGTVKDGDTVNVTSKGTLEGETKPFETSDYDFTIGAEEMIPGYEEALKGKNVGDTVKINLTFPEDYFNTELQGKKASFEVVINYIHGETSVPDWTDEFVQEITNGEYKNTTDYEAALRKELQANKNQEVYYTQQADIINYLVDNSVIHKFPEGLVETQYENYLEEYKQQNEENYGYDNFEDYVLQEEGYSSMDEFYDYIRECAENTATELLAYQAVAFKENLTLTKVEYENYLQSFASSEGYTTAEKFEEDFMSVYAEQDEDYLYKKFLNKKVLEYLQANAKSATIPAQ